MRAETIDPKPDCFPAYNHATLGKKILDICRAQREPTMSPDRVGDDLTRVAKAFRRGIDAGIFMFHPIAKSVRPNNLAMPQPFPLSVRRPRKSEREVHSSTVNPRGDVDRL